MKKGKLMKRVILSSVVLGSFFGLSKVGLADTNYGIQSVLDEETIAQTIEQNNATMGSSIKNNNSMSTFGMSLFSSATDTSLPNKDFIDVSSWNGAITVDQYKKMKSYGVKGVVVKLSEGTYYLNPQRFVQIKNAQAAGLTVSAYHYSKFATATAAKNEANYFANAAANTGLAKSAIFVNDAEDSAMASGNVTNNSVIFANTLKARGYSNVVHYSMADWVTTAKPKLNPNVLGKSNIWVAQYPYKPSKNKLLHTDYAAWQWASDMKFPGVATPIGGSFDINIDYIGKFTDGTYEKVKSQKATKFKAKVNEAAVSSKHGVWNGVPHTGNGIKYLRNASKYAGNTVTVLEMAQTSRATYWRFSLNGQSLWIDKAAFTPILDTVVEDKKVNVTTMIKNTTSYNVYSNPENTSVDTSYVGATATYSKVKATIVREVKLSTNQVFYQFSQNGKVIGWLNSKAFYDPILEQKKLNVRVQVKKDAARHGVWSAVPNTSSEAKYIRNGSIYAGKNGVVSASVRTAKSTYYKFTIEGKTYWMDQAAFDFKLAKIIEDQAVHYKVTLKKAADAKKEGIWNNIPHVSMAAQYLGNGQPYHSQQVIIKRIVKTSEGHTYYQFEKNGKVVGWLDKKAFHDPIVEEKNLTIKVQVKKDASKHGVWSAVPNSNPTAKYIGSGSKYAGKQGTVSVSIRTAKSTYYKFTIAGETYWMDQAAFNLVKTPKTIEVVESTESTTFSENSSTEGTLTTESAGNIDESSTSNEITTPETSETSTSETIIFDTTVNESEEKMTDERSVTNEVASSHNSND
ncbi:hypothetical protein BAU15_06805 [Enterococcus sp. JM4C]|uniref:GW dipeptide domain-containing protein n=1 Tax=Candidatus Enterococcus huntleyi TaxID=1857217 RepID=UPI001379C1DD|nr:GW dipeptide domain-containing protein [Enterococcus sp. JM4C]KAF1297251.1 hypothetical protein BAU15_06805 [Enterococcus sp. JM4C]